MGRLFLFPFETIDSFDKRQCDRSKPLSITYSPRLYKYTVHGQATQFAPMSIDERCKASFEDGTKWGIWQPTSSLTSRACAIPSGISVSCLSMHLQSRTLWKECPTERIKAWRVWRLPVSRCWNEMAGQHIVADRLVKGWNPSSCEKGLEGGSIAC